MTGLQDKIIISLNIEKRKISEAERECRREAVDFATASFKLEEVEISKKTQKQAERYINGQLTLDEFVNS